MKNIILLTTIFIMLMIGTSCSTTDSQINESDIENADAEKLILLLSLDSDVYNDDDKILAELTIRNVNGPLLVNKRMAANSSFAHPNFRDVSFIILDSGGKTLELNELIEVKPIKAEDFVLLRGLEGVIASYPDVGRHYRISTPGKYSIQARYENQLDPGDGRKAWKGVLYSNTVHFTIKP